MKSARAIIILSALFLSSPLWTQDITFRQITSEDGLSQSEVYSFLQDSKNYMWFGTLDGLNRYDGYTIITHNIDKENPNSLTNNTIYSLAEDRFGRIWIGTNNGLNIFDLQKQRFYSLPNFYSGRRLIVRALLMEERNLWVGTQEGLFLLKIPKNELTEKRLGSVAKTADHVDLEIRGKKSTYTSILSIIKASDGKIWLGTWEGVICFDFDPEREVSYEFYDDSEALHIIAEVNCLVEDVNNNIWIGTQNDGLYRYVPETDELNNFRKSLNPTFLSDNVKAITADLEGNLWIGTFQNGLQKINSTELLSDDISFLPIQNNEFQAGSLSSNLIRSLYVSRDGLLWIGTIGKGINILNPYRKRFGTIRIPPDDSSGSVNNFVRSVYKDDHRNLWLGLHNGGLIRYDTRKKSFFKMGMKNFFTLFDIHPCCGEYFWIATSKGAHIVDPRNDQVLIIASVNFQEAPDIIAYNACFNIEKSAPDIFWIASMSGIERVQIKPGFKLETVVYNIDSSPAISLNNTRVLLYDSIKNTLWAGTEGGGLNEIILDSEQFPDTIIFHQSNPESSMSLSSNYVRSLCLCDNNHLYAGTYEGLNRLTWNETSSTYETRVWKTDDGLANNMVQSIETDADGDLWIGTNGGLCRFDPVKEVFVNYQISDGLQSNEFSEHASYKSSDGELIFGGINGVNTFYPGQIEASPLAPIVTITDLYLFNERVGVLQKSGNHVILEKPIDNTDTLVLRSRENDIRFDFSALFYADPEKLEYAYMLEGYDENWIYTEATNRIANYTNLPFGNYIFKVKAANNDGLWNNNPSTLYIHINTPFFLKWWAILIYLLVFVFSIWYFTRYSIIRLTTKNKLVLESEHNQKLHELDILRTKFFINISHDLRTPLTLITGPVEKILKNYRLEPGLKRHLSLVSRSAQRLKYLVEQLLDFRKAEAGKLVACPSKIDLVQFIKKEIEYFDHEINERGNKLHIIHDTKEIKAWIDEDMMGKVIFNLMSNAIKYTRNGDIYLRILKGVFETESNNTKGVGKKGIIIEVEDSGRGMSKEKSKKIFERFYHDPENPGKGYGIGLSHTKDLVEAQQGKIEVSSIPDKGTKFTIYLPLENKREVQPDSKDPCIESVRTIKPGVKEENDKKIDEIDSDNLERILVVEDNADLREYLAINLEDLYTIIEASDGEEGLQKAKQFIPDLIISDIMMPKMDGIEFCQHIKSNIDTSHIPVILLTARVDDEKKYEGIETGADDYIHKPFDVEYLVLRVKNLLNSREQLRDLFRSNQDLKPSAVTVTSADDEFLERLMAIIEANIPDSEFSIEEMEKEIGMSHTNFYRKIKSLTGQSGKELLQNMRLKRAAHLISQDKIRISEVAYLSGFRNPKYFTKCFKEKYGVTPSEYITSTQQ